MKVKKKDKGGLITDVTSLIIAIIGISLLFFGFYQLYKVIVNQDSEIAKKTLNIIEAKINYLEEGQTGKFPIKGPKGPDREWYLLGWGKENSERPDKCYFDSCICICEGYKPEDCQGRYGFCRKVDAKDVKILEGNFEIKKPKDVQTGGGGNMPVVEYEYVTPKAIKFQENLIELQVKKTKEILEISYTK